MLCQWLGTDQVMSSPRTICLDHTHARARLASQISQPPGGWDLARSRVFSQQFAPQMFISAAFTMDNHYQSVKLSDFNLFIV